MIGSHLAGQVANRIAEQTLLEITGRPMLDQEHMKLTQAALEVAFRYSPCFVFPLRDDEEDRALCVFAEDLMQYNALTLPFPITVLIVPCAPITNDCAEEDRPFIGMDRGWIIVVAEPKERNGKLMAHMALYTNGNANYACSASFHWEDATQKVLIQGHLRGSNTLPLDRDTIMTLLKSGYSALFSSLGLLSTKAITVVRDSHNDAAREKSKKKGKPGPRETYSVSLNLPGVQYEDSGAPHGTHASPRPHWRRGHVRRLASGHISIVRPTLVNASEATKTRMKDYIVRGPKEGVTMKEKNHE